MDEFEKDLPCEILSKGCIITTYMHICTFAHCTLHIGVIRGKQRRRLIIPFIGVSPLGRDQKLVPDFGHRSFKNTNADYTFQHFSFRIKITWMA